MLRFGVLVQVSFPPVWVERTALAFSNGISLKAGLNFFQWCGEAGADNSLP